jgi:hypothetical protein
MQYIFCVSGALAEAVRGRLLTTEARVRSPVSPCEICGGQSTLGQIFPEYFGFPMSVSFQRCSITWKNGETNNFIRGLHNKPQDCLASIASVAGPFTIKYIYFGQVLKFSR